MVQPCGMKDSCGREDAGWSCCASSCLKSHLIRLRPSMETRLEHFGTIHRWNSLIAVYYWNTKKRNEKWVIDGHK